MDEKLKTILENAFNMPLGILCVQYANLSFYTNEASGPNKKQTRCPYFLFQRNDFGRLCGSPDSWQA